MRVDPNYITNLTGALDQSSALQAQLTAELSSGLRVPSLSDDPAAVAQSALLNTALSQTDTYVRTAAGVTSRLQVADSALGEAVTQATSAISVAVQGAGGTLNAANYSAFGQQISGIRDSILALANTSYSGTYLFSGSQGTTKPFSLDTTTVPATTVYAGDAQVQTIATPNGQAIQVNLPGASVFAGVLDALNKLVADFASVGPGNTIAADGSALTAALGQLSNQRTVLDTSINRLQSTSTYAQTQSANVTAAQSALVAADPAQVATQLSATETQHQALLSVISGLQQQTNLFGFIR